MTTTQDPRSRTAPTGTRPPWEGRRWPVLAGVIVISLVLVALVVSPQLSPRLSGTEVTLRVAPVDPIDPFRGAYVDLDYPDLPQPSGFGRDEDRGTAYVPLRQEGEVWVGGAVQRTEPDGLFLRCNDRGWRVDCGIHSWFAPQDAAAALEQDLRESGALATVRVDRWGNAAITDLVADE